MEEKLENIWKDIEDNKLEKGRYKVSNKGEVFDTRHNCLKAVQDNGSGYVKCAFSLKGGKIANRYIHRLVAKAFIPNPSNLPQVGHKDHNKENNFVENLYWTSQSQNTRDGVRDGRINAKPRGIMNRFSTADIEFIAFKVAEGVGVADIARLLDVPRTSVSSVINGRSNWATYCAAKKKSEEVELSTTSLGD